MVMLFSCSTIEARVSVLTPKRAIARMRIIFSVFVRRLKIVFGDTVFELF